MNRTGLFLLLAISWLTGCVAEGDIIPASDPTFLGSVLDETWDTRAAAAHGYIDGMLPLSDIDLTVLLRSPGLVTLHFDTSIYPPTQADGAGPTFEILVDGVRTPDRVTIGPKVSTVATMPLPSGRHRVRFVASSNTSSPRWNANDPQMARVTGVEIPPGSTLEKSQRSKRWFLAITDSIGEGVLDVNTTTGTWRTGPAGAYTDADRAWPEETARLLHESICGYLISGIGIVHPGTGVPMGAINPADPSGQSDAWDHIFAGVPRPFTTAPDFIILCVGTNECGTDGNIPHHGTPDPSSADAPFAANVKTFFAHVRAHPQLAKTPIYVSVPFDGCKRTALQKAVADYRAAHLDEKHIQIFDMAFGSPALSHHVRVADPLHVFSDDPVAMADEWTLFSGLTKDEPDDGNTVPSPEASDRTHPYAIATPAIGSVNAQGRLAEVIAPRLKTMLAGGPAPKTGALKLPSLVVIQDGSTVQMSPIGFATGGSAAYFYQFEKSTDDGKTWTKMGDPIGHLQGILHGIQANDTLTKGEVCRYRLTVTDCAEPHASVTQVARAKW